MQVVAVTVNYNHWEDTVALLKSVTASDLAEATWLVVDNGSTDDSVAVLKREFPTITVLQTKKNLGFAGGFNFGMQEALKLNPAAILIINNDTIVPPIFLAPLVQVLNSRPEIAAVAPKTLVARTNRLWWAGGSLDLGRGLIKNLGAGQKDFGQFTNIAECDYLSGVSILFKSEALAKVGLFDERFAHTGEDVDLSIRLRQAGYKLLVVPAAVLRHKVSATGGGEFSAFHLYNLEKYRLLLMKKWGYWQGLPSLIKLVPLFMWRLGGVILKGRSLFSLLAFWRGWRDGFYENFS